MFLDFGVFKKLHFRPFCAQRHSTATQPGASFCARLADFAKSCDRRCMDFFDHLSPYARKSVVRVPPSFFLVFFFFCFSLVGRALTFFWFLTHFQIHFRIFLRISSINVVIFDLDRSRESPGVVFRLSTSSFFLHKVLFTLRFWHTSPRRNHCCGLNPLCFTIDLKKPIAFSQPILRIGFNTIFWRK